MFLKNDKVLNNDDHLVTIIAAETELQFKIIEKYQDELKGMPEGNISRKVINGKQYFYHCTKAKEKNSPYKQKILAKNQNDLTSSLIRKQFIIRSLKCLHNNIRVLKIFAEKYKPYYATNIANNMVIDFQKSSHCFPNKASKFNAWLMESYEKNMLYPERLIHITACGLKVRSKSEVIIAGLLETNDIPFRYEAQLLIGGQIYYPDFTIMKPKDGQIIYWEHFGMINKSSYNTSMELKLNEFRRRGLIPWDHYIASYDNDNGSINVLTIQNIIKAFILN